MRRTFKEWLEDAREDPTRRTFKEWLADACEDLYITGWWIAIMCVVLAITLFVAVFAVRASLIRADDQKMSESNLAAAELNLPKQAFGERFVVIGDEELYGTRTTVVVDRQTRVEYLWTSEQARGNSMVMLAAADGHPLLYEGELPGE